MGQTVNTNVKSIQDLMKKVEQDNKQENIIFKK